MTVYVLANCFQEIENLPRMWESVQANVPGEVILVVVDGKYPDYDAPEDFSTDGTREFAIKHGRLVTCIDYECEKRSAGLRYIDMIASEGDWILNMDADETITSFFGWPERVGYFEFSRETTGVTYGRCRLYRWEPGLEFKHRHYDLFDASGALVSSLEDAPQFDPVGHGIHHNASHSAERIVTKRVYYKQLRAREGHPAEVFV